MKDDVVRITIRALSDRRKWEGRVTFDVPYGDGKVSKDHLEWPYYRPRSFSRSRLTKRCLRAVLRQIEEATRIEIIYK